MMMKLFKPLCISVLLSLLSISASAQVEMADTMRQEGKIYVVVAIIVIVLAGLILYLFTLDRKIKKLETLLKEKQEQTK